MNALARTYTDLAAALSRIAEPVYGPRPVHVHHGWSIFFDPDPYGYRYVRQDGAIMGTAESVQDAIWQIEDHEDAQYEAGNEYPDDDTAIREPDEERDWVDELLGDVAPVWNRRGY